MNCDAGFVLLLVQDSNIDIVHVVGRVQLHRCQGKVSKESGTLSISRGPSLRYSFPFLPDKLLGPEGPTPKSKIKG